MVKTSPSNTVGVGLIPGGEAKIPHALGPKNQNIKQRQYCNKRNKGFIIGPHQKLFQRPTETLGSQFLQIFEREKDPLRKPRGAKASLQVTCILLFSS